MKILSLFLTAAFLTSCATQKAPKESVDPFDRSLVLDTQPVTDPSDLRELIKSLPVWENREPGFIDGWIDRMGTEEGETLTIAGDGAQIALRLTKLASKNLYELEGGIEEWPEGGRFLYRLKRLNNGWLVLSRQKP